jgi:cytochrome c-type biogenesis protein CcmE
MVRKTIYWGNLSNEKKLEGRKVIRAHIEKYDVREAAKNIRLFLEEVKEGYRKR